MTVFWTLVRRELGGYFGSLTGYIVMAVVLFLIGLGFTNLLMHLSQDSSDIPLTELFYRTWYFWLIILMLTPGVTMRTFAYERSTGTYESLMTTPVSDWEVVLSKYSGALICFLLSWLPLIVALLVLRAYLADQAALTLGVVVSTYIGILLIGSLYVSIGCFTSAMTKNQTIAAMSSFGLGVALFILGFLASSGQIQTRALQPIMEKLAFIDHMDEFVRGVVDSRYVVFYASLTILFLFLTCRVIEARRWKS